MQFLSPHLVEGATREDVWTIMLMLAQLAAQGFVAKDGDATTIYGAVCSLRAQLEQRQLVSNQPTGPLVADRSGWNNTPQSAQQKVPLEELSIPTTLLVAGSGGGKEVYFDQRLSNASKVVFKDMPGTNHQALLFLYDAKTQISPASCKNWKAKAPQVCVCWVYVHNRADCFCQFWFITNHRWMVG